MALSNLIQRVLLQLSSAEIADGAITRDKIAADAINSSKVEAGSLSGLDLAANTITATQIDASAVGTDELAALAVTAAKIANATITATQLANDSVGSAQIQANAVGNSEMADNAIGTAEIQDAAVTAAKLASDVGAVTRFADTTVGVGGAANIDVSSIPGTAKHLLICGRVRSDTAATNTVLKTTLNGASAAFYGEGATVTGSGNMAGAEQLNTAFIDSSRASAGSSPAGWFADFIALVVDYANATTRKSIFGVVFTPQGTTTGLLRMGVFGGVLDGSNNAVTQVTFTPTAGNWVQYSRVSVYGLL